VRWASSAQPGPNRGQHPDQDVAVCFRRLREVGEDAGRGGVPGQDVAAAAGDVGGLGQAFDQAPDGVRHSLPGEPLVPGAAGQGAQVVAFGRVQAQGLGQGVDGGHRRPDRPALLQPHVPVHADAGQLGDLLAAQARGASPAAVGQAERRGAEPFPPGAEEVAELAAILGGRWHRALPGLSGPWLGLAAGAVRSGGTGWS
jgi:hypothetical protein